MESGHTRRALASALIFASLLGLLVTVAPASAQSSPVATPPYKISIFAKSPTGTTQLDSLVFWNESAIVGFQNHVAKDGSDGKFSTIVEFSLTGKSEADLSCKGT